jgi:hypothetical protein
MKRLVLFSCMMAVAYMGISQIPLGFKVGVNTNTIVVRGVSSEYWDNSDPGISFHLGVFTKLKLSNKLNFIPEVQFIQKLSDFSSGNFKLNYIELPLFISYEPIQWLNVEAGPSLGLNVSSNLHGDVYKKPDAGVIAGLRFNLTSKWSLLGRYYYGVTPIEEAYFTRPQQSPPRPETFKFYNETFQLSVAYYLK